MVSTKKRAPFSWTQPCCVECWIGLKLKIGRAMTEPSAVTFCCFCRKEIPGDAGVYQIRLNPGTVPYPTMRKEEK